MSFKIRLNFKKRYKLDEKTLKLSERCTRLIRKAELQLQLTVSISISTDLPINYVPFQSNLLQLSLTAKMSYARSNLTATATSERRPVTGGS